MNLPGQAHLGGWIGSWGRGGAVNLAVTGLSRAGKTVFITSTIANILACGAPMRTESAHRKMGYLELIKHGILKSSSLAELGNQKNKRFDYESGLQSITGVSATWPSRTAAVSEIALDIEFWTSEDERKKGDKGRTAKTRLATLDYPGEWLVDLPLLGQTFAQWSEQMQGLLTHDSRRKYGGKWREWIKLQNMWQPANDAAAKQGAIFWQEFLFSCRKASLVFLQPSHFIRGPNDVDDLSLPALDQPALWFFPCQAPDKKVPNSQYSVIESRFNFYRDQIVAKFFSETFSRFTRQAILVDVLGALTAGYHAFEDIKYTLRIINEAITNQNSKFPWPTTASEIFGAALNPGYFAFKAIRNEFYGQPKVEKLLFIATKADHVPTLQRNALKQLLQDIVHGPDAKFVRSARSYKFIEVASVVCTEEISEIRKGQRVDVIAGFDLKSKIKKGVIQVIPSDSPTRTWWAERKDKPFDFPLFAPPKNGDARSGIPNINLDVALQYLIGDKC